PGGIAVQSVMLRPGPGGVPPGPGVLALLSDDLDAPVLGATCCGLVARDGVGLAEPASRDPARADALRDHVVLDGLGTALRELHVVLVAADGIGVTFGHDAHARILLHQAHDVVHLRLTLRPQVGLVEVEVRRGDGLALPRGRRRGWRRCRCRRWRGWHLLRVAEEVADQGAHAGPDDGATAGSRTGLLVAAAIATLVGVDEA